MTLHNLLIAAFVVLWTVPAAAQSGCTGQFAAGKICGNATGSTALPGQITPSPSILAPIAGGTVIGNPTGSTAVPQATATPVLGIPGTTLGSIGFAGSASGTALLRPQGAAGSPTLLLPNTSGTLAASATAPIAVNASTGVVTCSTCVTSSGGGAITGTPPINVSAGGVVSITGSALTKADDTNVTLTLGGAPTTALISAASITAGWTGQLGLTRGGTNASLTASNGGLVYSGSSGLAILSGTATANQIPLSGSSSAPAWSTATFPSTAAAGTILNAATANAVTATAQPTLGANGGTGGQITLNGSTSGSAALRVPAAAGTGTIFQLPPDNGTNTYVLQTNGSGVTSWVASAGGGTVTSVGYAAGTGLALSGTASPITSTGSFTYALAAIAADNLLMNSTGSSAAPIATAVNNCTATASALIYSTTTHAFGCNTLVSSIAGNTGAFTLSTGLTNSTNAILIDKATSANLEAGASNKVLTSDNIYDSEVAITYAASLTLDFNTFLNGRVTLTGNVTSLTCSNIKASQSGTISWVQSSAGSYTMVAGWCSQFRWANGARGVLTTGSATAIDALFYTCVSTSVCYVSLAKAQAN